MPCASTAIPLMLIRGQPARRFCSTLGRERYGPRSKQTGQKITIGTYPALLCAANRFSPVIRFSSALQTAEEPGHYFFISINARLFFAVAGPCPVSMQKKWGFGGLCSFRAVRRQLPDLILISGGKTADLPDPFFAGIAFFLKARKPVCADGEARCRLFCSHRGESCGESPRYSPRA